MMMHSSVTRNIMQFPGLKVGSWHRLWEQALAPHLADLVGQRGQVAL